MKYTSESETSKMTQYTGQNGSAAAALKRLRRNFHGALYLPGDAGYDVERLGWNRSIDPRPAIVVTATSPGDVQAAIYAAREYGLPFAVQATGHGTVIAADDALLLKTSQMAAVEIDPQRRTARVGPGAIWEQVNVAAARFGLAALAGRCGTVGVTGYTLGGGTGWLSRKFGYAADSVVRAEVVTADGRLVKASADENPDLFWALRGGGGNFGVVTSLEFRLYPAAQLFAGMSLYPLDRAVETMAVYRQWALEEPDEMNTAVMGMRLPPHPSIPEQFRGKRFLTIRAFYLGGEAEGRRVLAPLLDAAGPPLLDGFRMMRFPEASAATNGPDVPPIAARQYVELFRGVPDAALHAMIDAGAEVDSPFAFIELRHWGGAMARLGVHAGPSGARDVPFSIMAVAPYQPHERERVEASVDGMAARLQPYATGGSFLNLQMDRTRTRSAFTEENYARLVQVKRTWDSDNFFRFNHNISPFAYSGGQGSGARDQA
jgi:UDP-N-acetylenolpyruvoylglucosamine reductase